MSPSRSSPPGGARGGAGPAPPHRVFPGAPPSNGTVTARFRATRARAGLRFSRPGTGRPSAVYPQGVDRFPGPEGSPMKVLGVNAVFHDPAAALVVDGETVAAAEEERFSRRKHGKSPVPFSTWELPEAAARWCLERGGVAAADLDAVAYSYDPRLAPATDDVTEDGWEGLRTLYAQRAPRFLATALPGLDPGRVRFVAHHVAHAGSAHLASPFDRCAVMVLD